MDEREELQTPPDDDKTPTQEDAAAPNAWTMPQPVFRSSSGYLPKGFEQRYGQNEMPTEEPAVVQAAPQTSGIAEQPHLTEEPESTSTPPDEIAAAPPKKKRGFLRILMMIIGVILAVGAVLAIIGIFLAWYVFRASDSGNF